VSSVKIEEDSSETRTRPTDAKKDPNMDVGATLRHARTRRGLTVEQLARSTKISRSTLEALENDDFDRLPGGVYTRGFLRAYAREVNLDPEETVEQYMEQFAASPSMVMAANERVETASHRREAAYDDETPGESRVIRIPVPLIAAAVLLVFLGTYFAISRNEGDTGMTPIAEAATTPPSPQPDATLASNVAPDVLRIEIKATGPCWVSATADRESALSRLLKAGDAHTLEAKDELVLRVGDPSTVAIVVNGVPSRPLGRPGQPVTVQINKQNYREFQQL
jgi:cytoskeleton protein RodZ